MAVSAFVDVQINGYLGVNFSDAGLRVEDVLRVADALGAQGTALFLPTVVTSSEAAYEKVLPVLATAMAEDPHQRMPGIHLEGPFISPLEGAVGAHPPEHVRAPSVETFDRLNKMAGGNIKLLTLAPETAGAAALIKHAVDNGVVVSLGHSAAKADDIAAAVEAGATLSTHLGNGCPNMINRHHNPIWPQLANARLTTMLITDSHHLPDEFIRVAAAAKGARHIIITCDCAPIAGLEAGDYSYFGTQVSLHENGRLQLTGTPYLAGSSANTLHCMNYLAGLGILDEADLWRVGRDNALAMLGLSELPEGGYKKVCFEDGIFSVIDN